MPVSDSSGNALSSSSSLAVVGEVEALIASLQAASVEWRDKKFSVAQHMQYARSLCQLQETVTVVASNHAVKSLVDRGLVAQCIAMSTEHAALGMMSWLTVRTWEAILTALLGRMHQVLGSTSSLAHLVHPVWATVSKLAKAALSSRAGEAALIASMRLLAVLLQFCPVELVVLRRALPHPLRALSDAARASGYALLPWLAVNAKSAPGDAEAVSGPTSSSSSAGAYPILSADLLEYVRKGLVDSKEMAVRAAATEAVRVMLEAGIRVTEEASHVLLAALVGVCEGRWPQSGSSGSSSSHNGSGGGSSSSSTPSGLAPHVEQDAGLAMGYLLALFQSGHALTSLPRVLEGREMVRWPYVGGSGPTQAARVQATVLLPRMSRHTQMALGTAVATLWRLCVSPPAMADALRAFFMLLVPTPSDSRAYMPRIVVNALALWAQQMPSNQYRAALVYCLRDLLRRTGEARVILHTALLGLAAVVCTLESTRQVSRGLSEDMKQLVATQPSLSGTVAEVMAALATHSPHFRRTLLQQIVGTYKRYAMPGDEDRRGPASRAEASSTDSSEAPLGEGAFTMTVLLLSRTTLALPPALLASTPLMKVLLTAVVCLASVEPPRALRDGDYRQMEYYFLFAAALLRYHRHSLSSFLLEKLESSTRMFLSLLVGHPSTTPSYLRAASAACNLLLVRGDVCLTDTMLCVGLLEGQVLNGAADTVASAPMNSLLGKLKGGVFDLVRETQWASATAGQLDLGSLRWTVTQALNTLEEISRDEAGEDGGVEVVLTDEELFPDAVVSLLGTHRPHAAATTGLPRVLAETGHQAIQLVAWAVEFFHARDMDFCRDVVRRLASAAPGTGRSGPRAGRVAQWNTLCVQLAVLEALQRLPAADRRRWTTHAEAGPALQQWKDAALRVAQALRVDVEERLLAAKVVAHLLRLFDGVDAFTVAALRLSATSSLWPTTGSAAGGAGAVGGGGSTHNTTNASASTAHTSAAAVATAQTSGTLLILGQAHGAVEQPGTFSMAVSLFAESLRRTGLAGDAQRSLVLSTLLGVLSLMEVHVSDVQDTILDALLAALAVPMQAPLDPLTHSLVLAILAELDFSSEPLSSLFALAARTALDAVAWQGSTVADVMDGRVQLLCEATASELHQLQLPARAMVLQHLVMAALKESTLAVPFYLPGYSRTSGTGGTSSSAHATASNSARLAAARRRQGHTFRLPWSLPDSSTEWIAQLAAQCVVTASISDRDTHLLSPASSVQSSLPMPPPLTQQPSTGRASCAPATLNLLEVSVLIDAAATESARDTWANVALELVLSATPAASSVQLQDISKVMQARLPDLGELLSADGRRRGLGDAVGAGLESDDEDALGVTYGSNELARRLDEAGSGQDDDDDDDGAGTGGSRRGRRPRGAERQSLDEVEATPICGDVASKVAYLALLVVVCDRCTPSASEEVPSPVAAHTALASDGAVAAATAARRSSEVRLHQQCLEVAVASVPLVETIPELLESAVALLQQVFQPTAEEQQAQQPAAQAEGRRRALAVTPSLVRWKIPLVAALKTVVQLSIFDSFPACQLVRRFLRCELADDTAAKRVTRGLLLLLMALEHLEAEAGHELISKDAGRVALTLSEVLAQAVKRHWPQTAAVATEGLGSPAGQAALAVLCRHLCCSVALANGCHPPADIRVPHSVAPEEGVDASMVLQAAVQLGERPGATMGPSLRHAVGCLACLVAATDGADLAPVARLVGELPMAQQQIIAGVAWETLETSLVPVNAAKHVGSRSISPHSFDTVLAADTICLISEEEEQYLLDILVSSGTHKPAERLEPLVEAVLAAAPDGELPPALELRALLALALQTHAPAATAARVVAHVHVEQLRLDASPVLVDAAVAYVARATVRDMLEVAQASAAGCVLMERACGLCAHRQHLERRRRQGALPSSSAALPICFSPLSMDEVSVAVVERLREALLDTYDPASLVRFMWPQPMLALKAVTVCLSLLCAEPKALLVAKAAPVLCDLFFALLEATPEELDVAAADDAELRAPGLQQRLHLCVGLLTSLVTTAPQAELLCVVLQPVGVALMKTVAREHPVEMRAAIQQLGPERALVLRGFMEQSSLATATAANATR